MALDRFVYWDNEKPSEYDIGILLQNYMRDAAKQVEWKGARFIVFLFGYTELPGRSEKRVFEVYISKDAHIDVITRDMDDYTNAVAEGFARLAARRWKGRLEQG